jgi:hypothetical protein
MAMKIIAAEMHAPIREVLFLRKVVNIFRRLPRFFIATVPAFLRTYLYLTLGSISPYVKSVIRFIRTTRLAKIIITACNVV